LTARSDSKIQRRKLWDQAAGEKIVPSPNSSAIDSGPLVPAVIGRIPARSHLRRSEKRLRANFIKRTLLAVDAASVKILKVQES
jgi:hypothetical protein